MNIGSVIRGLMGDAKAGDSKKLELQTGQVVRGTVMQVSDDGNEAVIQIQGAQVRAKLETPLQAGQTTLLQVQPPGENGMAVLKPLSQSPYLPLPSVSLSEVLKSVGLPDTADNRELIQLMQRNGIPLTQDNAKSLREVANQLLPGGAKLDTLVQSAAVALQRGLPMTPQSIAGLQQAIFGPSLDQLLTSLEKLVDQALRQGSNNTSTANGSPTSGGAGNAATTINAGTSASAGAATGSVSPQGTGTAAGAPAPTGMGAGNTGQGQPLASSGAPTTVQAGSQQGTGGTAGATGNTTGGASPAVNGSQSGATGTTVTTAGGATGLTGATGNTAAGSPMTGVIAANASGAAALTQQAAGESTSNQGPAAAGRAEASVGNGKAAATGTPQSGAQLQQLRTVLQELRGLVPTPLAPAQASAPEHSQGAATGRAGDTPQPGEVSARPAAETAVQPPATREAEPWVGRLLKLLGAEHEQQVLRPANGSGAGRELPGLAQAANGQQADAAATVKGMLLQLMSSSDDVPPALREAAQQVVQHLTGQQLLLNTDRTAPFAQVHLFIPFIGPDGQETASVQIQSRRGKKGELDPANCRLWFDLDMHALGPTLLDVQVVDRIVSVKVHNDSEWAGALLESGRDSVTEGLAGIGYQLLSLRAEPMPVRAEQELDAPVRVAEEYAPQTYKGVDVKI
ncbi:DNA ligase [Paenibacillus sp. FSL K6-1230]|uniref:DNA ligase n=1 Tax=Paenibacillus sp. FSL K6-1230 TaxID=2921603 RepID=UPI0030FA0777